MSAKKSALGRGLGALIDNSPNEEEEVVLSPRSVVEDQSVTANIEIELDKIEINPHQPRTSFDEEALDELAASITVHGLIQPLTLRLLESGRYQIISGERRFRASKIAGLKSVPAYVRTANDQETLEMGLIENIQREDLDAMEVAITYRRLMEECNLTQEALSERIGKKRATVANYVRLLNLPADIQDFIRHRQLSMGHARSIVSINDTKVQRALARKIVDEGLSVRQAEDAVKKLHEVKAPKSKQKEHEAGDELPENYCTLVELLEMYFNNKINIKRNERGEGSITIHFASDTDVDKFIENLSK